VREAITSDTDFICIKTSNLKPAHKFIGIKTSKLFILLATNYF